MSQTKKPRKKFTHQLTVESVAAALRKHRGRAVTVARIHGVTESAVCQFIDRHPELEVIRTEARKQFDDVIVYEAESALLRNIKAGKEDSIKFALRHRARDRYSDEMKMPPLQLLINVLSPDEMSGLRAALAARLENPPPRIPAPEPNDKQV